YGGTMRRKLVLSFALLAAALTATYFILPRTATSSIVVPTVKASDEASPGSLQSFDPDGKPRGFCPLKHTDVKAEISGFLSRVTVTQEFQNPFKDKIEAVYTFPLSQSAAVDSMTMYIGDRVVRGKIKEREEARAIYEAARSAGHVAALLDQERPNIFTQS